MYKSIAVSALCAIGGCAQTVAPKALPAQPQMTLQLGDMATFGPIGITTAMAGPMATTAGAPYSAESVTERVQALADGNRIVQTSSGNVARDSKGRVRREEALPGLGSNSGDAPHLVFIDDPVAGVHWNLDTQSKTAIKMEMKFGSPGNASFGGMPPTVGPNKVWFTSPVPPGAGASVQIIQKETGSDSNVAKTSLGTQTVEGVPAQGTRITRILPAGSVGNEQPLTITTETWYSPDLKVLVMSKTSDPRMGETTYKLTNIQRSEPPASLFEVPDDYTVKDKPAGPIVFHEIKKNP